MERGPLTKLEGYHRGTSPSHSPWKKGPRQRGWPNKRHLGLQGGRASVETLPGKRVPCVTIKIVLQTVREARVPSNFP